MSIGQPFELHHGRGWTDEKLLHHLSAAHGLDVRGPWRTYSRPKLKRVHLRLHAQEAGRPFPT